MKMYEKGANYDNVELLPWETDMLIEHRNSIDAWIREEILPTMPAKKQFKVDFGKRFKGIDSKPTTDFHLIVNAEPRIYASEYPDVIPDKIIRIGVTKRYGWCPTAIEKITDTKMLYALSDYWLKIKSELEAQLEKNHQVQEEPPVQPLLGYSKIIKNVIGNRTYINDAV